MVDLSGYKLTFSEEFNSRSISKDGKGTVWANIRPEWKYGENADIGFGSSSFVDPASGYDPFDVSGGALTITATKDPTSAGYPGSWESGLIHSKNSFAQTYGYFEMRADLSDARGSWDAFWLIPSKPANNLPGFQELDVVEHYGDNNRGVYSWIHTTDPSPDRNAQRHVYSDNPQITSGYHTFGMEWSATKISFYVDGVFKGARDTPSDMHASMYLVANLATTPGTTGGPMSTKIDYIRAYSKDASAVAVSPGTVSAPDGKDPGFYGATTASGPGPIPPTPLPPTPQPGPAGLVLNGTAGNDRLLGRAGDDQLFGGAGNDELTGGAGRDKLYGGAGNDVIRADADDLVIDGGAGRDTLYFEGSRGASIKLASASIEEASGSAGNDTLDGSGSLSALKLFGRDGDDVLTGGDGRDELTGGAGRDKLYGGAGDDVIRADADDLAIDGGAGRDTVYFEGSRGVALKMASASIEEANGSAGADVLDGSGSVVNLRIRGQGGDDVLKGGGGRDELEGGAGRDTLHAGIGNDLLTGGADRDTFVFDTLVKGNVTTIRDFTPGVDRIALDLDLFSALPGDPAATSGWFTANATGRAMDADDHIIFDTRTGVLSYDVDGIGGDAAFAFARLNGVGMMTPQNFDFL